MSSESCSTNWRRPTWAIRGRDYGAADTVDRAHNCWNEHVLLAFDAVRANDAAHVRSEHRSPGRHGPARERAACHAATEVRGQAAGHGTHLCIAFAADLYYRQLGP